MGFRALFSGITGLQAHSTWLDVIGNNLANVNTTAFKASRVLFSDQIAQTLAAGSSPSASSRLGGVNPQQAGLGTRVCAVQMDHRQGPLLSTGNAFDLAIEGEGFLLVREGNRSFLTRSGALRLDGQGNLVDEKGGFVQGFSAQAQYRRTLINSVSSVPGEALAATDASLTLRTDNPMQVGNIRIEPRMTIPPKATSIVHFAGNLDSFQQANQPGGVLNLATGGGWPTLPVGGVIMLMGPAMAMDGTRVTTVPTPDGGFTLQQLAPLSAVYPGTNLANPLINGGMNLGYVQLLAGNYAWEQEPPLPPSSLVTASVYDSLGNPRELTVHFYQVMDLGAAGVNSPNGPSQACYAWYAFDTTNGAKPSTANLLAGTGITEGDYNMNYYDRGTNRDCFISAFVYFNTDGSLANSGCAGGPIPAPPGPPNYMINPRVYMPPYNGDPPIGPIPTMGAEILPIELDFGTFGFVTEGRRDGIYSDAAGAYEIRDGINQYVPNHSVHVESQDGYPEGMLEGITIGTEGILRGAFTNGQIVDLAQIVTVRVDNPGGLMRGGDGRYSGSNNSGSFFVGLPGQGGLGLIRSGTLEGSNVDLTLELSNMIVAQRGLEANSRIVTTESQNQRVLTNLGR